MTYHELLEHQTLYIIRWMLQILIPENGDLNLIPTIPVFYRSVRKEISLDKVTYGLYEIFLYNVQTLSPI